MGSDHWKRRWNFVVGLIRNTNGDAVVEATVLFPVMIMIFAALVLLSIYLPAQAALQRATQHAATALATECSDTWLFFDAGNMTYYRESDRSRLKNVYADMFTGSGDVTSKGEIIVIDNESRSISSKAGSLTIDECTVINRILYKEVVVTATREFPMPVNLSFIGFPESISITATSVIVVQNGDEFIRNMDIADDFLMFIIEKYNLFNLTETISSFGSRVSSLLGW